MLNTLLQAAQYQQHSATSYSGIIMLIVILILVIAVVLIINRQKSKNNNNNVQYPTQQSGNYMQPGFNPRSTYCPKCGSQMINGARFCSNCGYDISLYGQNGNTENDAEKELSKDEIDSITDVYNPQTVWNKTMENNPNGKVTSDISATTSLMELKKLLDYGIITQEDYDNKKRQFLDNV